LHSGTQKALKTIIKTQFNRQLTKYPVEHYIAPDEVSLGTVQPETTVQFTGWVFEK